MKTKYQYILSALALAGSLVACSPDEIDGINEAGVPEANAYSSAVKIAVDQTTNQVSLKLDAPAVYPIWTITMPNGKTEKTTVNGYERIFVNAGDYTVTMKVGNRDGISDGTYTTTFHIDNTIIDFGKYTTILSKANWHIANKETAHLACGESGTDGTNWWKAGENEKMKEGVYDNELTFGSDYSYHFEPGDHGTIYVNKGVTIWPDYRDENADFNVPVEAQDATYGFDVDGDDLYITFPKGTYFPYIANDYIWNTPKYKVINMTTKKMTLLIDEPDVIAWQYILTTENTVSSEKPFTGFTYDQPDNIWKKAEVEAGGIYYADGSWTPYPNNGGATFVVTNQENKVVLPLATASQWQAQFPIITNIGPGSEYMTSSKNYDFSCVISSNKDLKAMTLKLVETGDNGVPGSLGIAYDDNDVFYNNETNLVAYEDYVFYLVDQKGVDIQDNFLQLVMDFGGCEEGTEVTVKDIVLIEHDKNTELGKLPGAGNTPGGSGDEPTLDWNTASGSNLWSAVESGDAFISVTPWFADGGWVQIADPAWSHENGEWNVTIPEGMGGSQWQGQFPINTTLTASLNKKYNFYCVVEADNDCPGVTIKLTETDEGDTKHDQNFFFDDRHDIAAYTPFVYKATGVSLRQNDAHALSLFFDFGGSPIGTNVKISQIYFEEAVVLDYNSDDNMWKAVDSGDAFLSVTPWFADGGWSQIADPEWNHEGNAWELTIPEGMGVSQWQGQFPINTTLTALQSASYNFSCTIEADNDCPGVTIKLTETDEGDTKHDQNFFFDDRHDIAAYEPFVYTIKGVTLRQNDAHALSLFFDFGGSPIGTNVKITNIIFTKAQ